MFGAIGSLDLGVFAHSINPQPGRVVLGGLIGEKPRPGKLILPLALAKVAKASLLKRDDLNVADMTLITAAHAGL
ncbi:hypothetical protein EV13_1734 [Prochlorococcus sp. MIT 0702]|nr:hypothetical protein EV13_1734 [Prochlorococcus sp. MIT 0702]